MYQTILKYMFHIWYYFHKIYLHYQNKINVYVTDNLPQPIECLKVRTKPQILFPLWITPGIGVTQIEIISVKIAVVAALSEQK